MSALVLLYVVGFGVLIAAAAAAIEWGVQGRIPTRDVWTLAMIAAVAVPPLTLVQRARTTAAAGATATTETVLVQVVQVGRDAGAVMGAREPGTPLHALRTRLYMALDRVEHVRARSIVELWSVASLALLAWIVTGLVHWRRERHEWEETELDGVTVHLSEETGPAVHGIITQRIVLPAWARALAPEYRQLMLAHECEHIAAGDPQRLALALAALVVMPWNPALWWCAARMRRAIEMDCDARVLRQYPSPREYGYLLLQVAARGTNAGPLAVPLVNLLRLPSELELRLRAMTRPRTIAGRTAVAGLVLGSVAVAGAFTTPVPRVGRFSARALLMPAGPRIALRGAPRAWVRVRDSIVRRDSVRVDGARGMTHGLLPPALRPTVLRDTLPSARAEDSLRILARTLAERTRQVDSMRARMDSMRAALESQQRPGPRRSVARFQTVSSGEEDTRALVAGRRFVERDTADDALKAYFNRSAGRIDAAIGRYYPNLATDATTNTVVWFLADSTGSVVRTVRKDAAAGMVSAQSAARVFGDVDAKDIEFVSIRKWTAGDRQFAVAWIELKR